MDNREPIFNVPKVVVIITAIFFAIHALRALLTPQDDLWVILALSFIPARFTVTEVVIPGGDLASVTSFITYMFLHGDFMHLAVNSIWLLAFGSAVARRIGTLNFLVFSALCGIGGVLTHLACHWGALTPVLGASAAISGQMAGAMRFFFGAVKEGKINDMRNDPRSVPLISIRETFTEPRILLFLAIWMGLNILFGLGGVNIGGADSIAWEAHIGGFLTGLLLFQRFDNVNPVNPRLT